MNNTEVDISRYRSLRLDGHFERSINPFAKDPKTRLVSKKVGLLFDHSLEVHEKVIVRIANVSVCALTHL